MRHCDMSHSLQRHRLYNRPADCRYCLARRLLLICFAVDIVAGLLLAVLFLSGGVR